MAIDNIPLTVTENTQEVALDIDDTSHPYYVGARAYVTQIPQGAIVTVIDKFGRTEATLLDGNYGNITDISYDPDTRTIKKVNGVVVSDLVTLSDVAISNDYEDLDNLPALSAVALSNDYGDLDNLPSIPTTAEDVGAVPVERTINSKALSDDISIDAADVGAPTVADVNCSVLGATDLGKWKQMTLKVIASFLAHEVESTCVVGTPTGTAQKFVAKYSGSKALMWVMSRASSSQFVYSDTETVDGFTYPILYSECNSCANLIARGREYENSPFPYCFANVNSADINQIRALFSEVSDASYDSSTIDWLNALTTYKNAFLMDAAGVAVRKVAEKVNGEVVWDDAVLSTMDTGDIVFVGANSNTNYKGIHHIAYFIKDIQELNPYGNKYGVTFKVASETIVGTGEHGYLFEVGNSLKLSNDYTDIFRIRDLDVSIETGATNDIVYVAKPYSNTLLSNKRLRQATGLYVWYDGVSVYDKSVQADEPLTDGAFKVVSYTYKYTLSAETGMWITSNNFGISSVSGYTPIGVVAFDSGDTDIYTRAVRIPPNNNIVSIKNTSASQKTATYTITFLYSRI